MSHSRQNTPSIMSLPSQTKFIVGNEACERFSFYGMRSILVLYMTGMLAMSESAAVEVAHLFLAGIYILPLLGAWIADRFLGRYRTILYISLFYCLGHGVLATADLTESIEMRRYILFLGLFIIALGAGGIKPCVSAFVGDQVDARKEPAVMTRVYAAFYWSINLGSFFSFLVIPWVRQTWGYSWAFGIPGIFMGLATLIFWLGRKQYKHIPPTQPTFLPALLCRIFRGAPVACERFGGAAVNAATNTALGIASFIVIAPIVILLGYWAKNGGEQLVSLSGGSSTAASLCGLAALLLYVAAILAAVLKLAETFNARGFMGVLGTRLYRGSELTAARYSEKDRRATRNLLRVLAVFAMIIPFWSLFDQTMSSWVIQGKEMTPVYFSAINFRFGAEEIQSFNPLLVMIFVPLITLCVYPYIGKWSTPLKRMGIGIVLAGVSYGSVAWLQARLDSGETLSILWQCIPYFLITISEILVSTTGLEYAYTAAGKSLKSIVSSFWFLTSTLGNFLVIYMTGLVSDPAATSTFLIYGALSVIIGILFIIVTTRPGFKAEPEEE